MANLTIKNVPEPLYLRLKATAERSRRSLNSEVIHRLERSMGTTPVDTAELLASTRTVREGSTLPYLTDEALREARREGRA